MTVTGPEAMYPPQRSDDAPQVLAAGSGDVCFAVLSMSARSADGEDARYLEWHVLDHLPEQHRIAGVRWGQRWISTPGCRAARAASEPPFDEVDHIVSYLFAEPVDVSLATFFDLGDALFAAGRMPVRLPRRHLAGYDVVAKTASTRVPVGADVLPWRPARGIYVIVERNGGTDSSELDGVADLGGVAGIWRLRGTGDRHARFQAAADLEAAVCFLEGEPVAVARAIGARLVSRWSSPHITPLLAAPFEVVVAWDWDRALPGAHQT